MLRGFGADVVGMSTVPEVIVAAHAGLRVVGFSIVTDLCLPDALQPVAIEHILKVAAEGGQRLSRLIPTLVERLDEAAGITTSNRTSTWEGEDVVPLSESEARDVIRSGDATLAIVFRADFGQQMLDGESPVVELLADTSDQIATQLVSALVRQEVSLEQGRQAAEKAAQAAPQIPRTPVTGQSPALTNVVPDSSQRNR